MVFANALVDVGVAVLLACAIADYCKFTRKSPKGFSWLMLGGLWLVFAGLFGVTGTLGTYIGATVWGNLGQIFEILGWLFALIGTLFVAYEVLVEK